MKPPPFAYRRPGTLDETLGVLASYGDAAKVLAGGQSLVPMMNLRLARPEVLVDINRVEELRYVRAGDRGVRVGAAARDRAVERSPEVTRVNPLLQRALYFVGHPPIRNRGTVCGSLAHADPAAELPAVALATGARMTVASARAVREIPAEDFFTFYFTTALEPDELLVEAAFPALDADAGWGLQEVSRRHGDFALVGVATVLTARDGACREARIAIFGGGAVPVRAHEAEAMLTGAPLTAARFADAGRAAAASVTPNDDVHASAAYRKEAVRVLTARALQEACRRMGRRPEAGPGTSRDAGSQAGPGAFPGGKPGEKP